MMPFMDPLEKNSIFAAVLVALILLSVSGLVARTLVHPRALEQQAFVLEAGEGESPAAEAGVAEAVIEPVEPLLAGADVARGADLSRKCIQCHTFDKGGPNRIGPNLWGVVGRLVAQGAPGSPGYAYSKVLQDKVGESWTWDALNHFLAHPQGFAPRTRMSFAGLKKVQDRADLIAWMRTMADVPVSLP